MNNSKYRPERQTPPENCSPNSDCSGQTISINSGIELKNNSENRLDSKNTQPERFSNNDSSDFLCSSFGSFGKPQKYINEKPKIVRSNSQKRQDFSNSKVGEKLSKKKIKRAEKRNRTISREWSHRPNFQQNVSVYNYVNTFDEIDCKMILLMSKGYYQKHIADAIGRAKSTTHERIKRMLNLGLIKKKIPNGKFVHYDVPEDLRLAVKSRLDVINSENNNSGIKSLRTPETPDRNHPKNGDKPDNGSKNVHHIIGVVRVKELTVRNNNQFVQNNDRMVRFVCDTCPKFEENYKNRKNCSCKRGNFKKMKNWDSFSVFYRHNGKKYEIQAANSRNGISIVVRCLTFILNFKDKRAASELLYEKALNQSRSILERYLDRYFHQTGKDVQVDWESFKVKGTHLVLEEDPEKVRRIKEEFDSQTINLMGSKGNLYIDESTNEEGIRHSHVEWHQKGGDLSFLDFYQDILNGNLHSRMDLIEQTLLEIISIKESLLASAQSGVTAQQIKD